MQDEVWFRDFYMKYITFVKLCDFLKPYIQHWDINYRDVIPLQKALAMVLHKLSHAWTNWNAKNISSIGKTTVLK